MHSPCARDGKEPQALEVIAEEGIFLHSYKARRWRRAQAIPAAERKEHGKFDYVWSIRNWMTLRLGAAGFWSTSTVIWVHGEGSPGAWP